MADVHSFRNTVVAIFESPDKARIASDDLREAGFPVEVIQGEGGSDHLDPEGEESLWASLKRLATALGDENRIIRRLDAEIAEGNVAISMDISDLQEQKATDAVSILREHGGRFIWKFGEWAFTPIEI